MSNNILYAVPLTPSTLYDGLDFGKTGKNNIIPLKVEDPIYTGITRGVYEGNRLEDRNLSLLDKASLMHDAAMETRQRRANIDMQVGNEMRLKRKNGLGSGYNIPIMYNENSKVRAKGQYYTPS